MSKRAVILGNGRLRTSPDLRTRLKQADVIVCADGGLRIAHALRISPTAVVGDLDSAPAHRVRWAKRLGASVRQYSAAKEKTDTELALELAVQEGATDIEFIGVLGGRVDHALANVYLLRQAAARGVRARIVHGSEELFLVDGVASIDGSAGDRVSLLPLSERVEGVTLHGLKYALTGATLARGSTLGVSNEIVHAPASVRISQGLLLVVVAHRRTRRRGHKHSK